MHREDNNIKVALLACLAIVLLGTLCYIKSLQITTEDSMATITKITDTGAIVKVFNFRLQSAETIPLRITDRNVLALVKAGDRIAVSYNFSPDNKISVIEVDYSGKTVVIGEAGKYLNSN